MFRALPQAIKLYTPTGLWWTKSWILFFLLSFGIIEAFLNVVKYQCRGSGGIEKHPLHDPDETTMKEADLMGFRYCVLPLGALHLGFFGSPGRLVRIENPKPAGEDRTWPFIVISVFLAIVSCAVD